MTRIEERVSELEQRLARLEDRLRVNPPPVVVGEKPTSIREFLLASGARSDVEKTLFAGHFLEKIGRQASFNVDDLRNAFAQAKEPRPANLNDAVNKNVQKGLMMNAPERKAGMKAWVLTNSGESFVESRRGQPTLNSEGRQ